MVHAAGSLRRSLGHGGDRELHADVRIVAARAERLWRGVAPRVELRVVRAPIVADAPTVTVTAAPVPVIVPAVSDLEPMVVARAAPAPTSTPTPTRRRFYIGFPPTVQLRTTAALVSASPIAEPIAEPVSALPTPAPTAPTRCLTQPAQRRWKGFAPRVELLQAEWTDAQDVHDLLDVLELLPL